MWNIFESEEGVGENKVKFWIVANSDPRDTENNRSFRASTLEDAQWLKATLTSIFGS